MDEGRYSRNEALFGPEGQARIGGTSVMIVGLGGLGSAVAQQLAYLGVQRFRLIDADIVSLSNLNRLIGAHQADADLASKVAVAERMIRAIQPTADVTATQAAFGPATASLAGVEVIIGCVDRDQARLRLVEACGRARTPYLDLASDTGGVGASAWFGGRVVLNDGSACLSCLGLLNQDQMARDSMTADQAAVVRDQYGLEETAFEETGPAIVSVNTTVASIAVTEFMKLVTGFGVPARQLTYRGDLQTLRCSIDPPAPGCWYCSLWTTAAA